MSAKIALHDIADPRRRPAETRSRWQIFSAAPHRMMFAGGFVQLLFALSWWTLEMIGRYTPLWPPLPTSLFSTWGHALLMVYGIFPFFIFGFLMTTYPRWLRGEEISRRWYVPAFLLLAGGMVLFDTGLLLGRPLLAGGLVVFLAGWGVAVASLVRVYLRTQAEDSRYESVFNLLLAAGAGGVIWALIAILSGNWMWLYYAVQVGLWLFLVPLLVGVGHRMIPYFTAAVLKDQPIYRPFWLLPAVVICAAGHAALSTQALWGWRLLCDVPLLAITLHLSLRWGLRRSFADRLLAVLHVAFLWLSVALLLFCLQSAWLLIGGELLLPKAPLHALSIGFMLSLLVGMASRVVLGHSGRWLLADNPTWYAFWCLSGVALLRIAADVPLPGFAALNLGAALLALGVALLWAWRYLPVLWRPRVDGKPG